MSDEFDAFETTPRAYTCKHGCERDLIMQVFADEAKERVATALAALEAENAELRAEVERLREALEGLVTDPEDDPCWYDHHGYCQAHGINAPCEMAIARAALGSGRNE